MRKYVKSELIQMVENGKTMGEIGYIYGVSRQRIYQLLTAFGIQTFERKRKRISETWTESQRWLWRTLSGKINTVGTKADKLEIFDSIRLPKRCPVLNLELDYSSGKGTRTENSPSLDRVDSNKGYVKGNLHVISWRANRIKNDATPQELRDIANYFENL